MKNIHDNYQIPDSGVNNFDYGQEQYLYAVFDTIPAAISIIALTSRAILYRNADVLSLLDYDRTEIANMSLNDRLAIFHEDDLPVISAYYDRFLSLKDSHENHIAYRMRHKKGHWESISTTGRIFRRNENGLAVQALIISKITAEAITKENPVPQFEADAEQSALLESKKRFQSIVNLVPDLLWDSDPDGSTNWYNERWLEYTGQTFEQAIGWGWIDTIHPDDREDSASRYEKAVADGAPLVQEHRIRRHDGAYRWFVVNALPLKDTEGNVVKMYGSATDIHDRMQAEEALRESEEKYRSLYESRI